MSHLLSDVIRLRRAALAALFAVLGMLAFAAPGATAATFKVNSEADLPDANPGSDGCEASNGKCTLRAAVEEANAQSSDDVAKVPNGNYILEQGQLSVAPAGKLAVRGSRRHGRSTVIDARGNSRVFEIQAEAEATLRGVTVTGGETFDGGGGIITGGGSTTKLVQSRVNGNRTQSNGGGIDNHGSLTVLNSDVETNSADDNGGGISNGAFALQPPPERAAQGSLGPSLEIKLSRVNNNDAEIGGGGIYSASGTTDSYRSTVSGNTAGQFGGGILGSVSGGIITARGPVPVTSRITLDTSTISSNKSGITGFGLGGDGSGGGIMLFGGALMHAENVTIAANTNNASDATTGGGLALDGGNAELRNSIVGDNRSNGQIDNCRASGGTIDSLGFNLENEDECSFDEASDKPNKNPRLGRLRLNRSAPDGPKGRGETHKIAPDSPAHNGGPQNCGPLDERGLARPQGPRCDIGAFERRD